MFLVSCCAGRSVLYSAFFSPALTAGLSCLLDEKTSGCLGEVGDEAVAAFVLALTAAGPDG